MRTPTANRVLEAAQAVLLDESSDPMEIVWAMSIVQANSPPSKGNCAEYLGEGCAFCLASGLMLP